MADRIARLNNHVINVLHAPARLAAKEAKAKETARRAEQAAKDQAMLEEEERKQREEDEEERARIAAESQEDSTGDTAMDVEPEVPDDVAEVMNLARSLAAGLAVPSQPTPPPAESSTSASQLVASQPTDAAAPVVDTPAPVAAPEASGSGVESTPTPDTPAVPADAPVEERVTITIHGEVVDITDTGIDPTFLEALPDDMREEVLSQHHREARSSRRPDPAPGAPPSQINAEFLDALPPELRDEVLRQEAAEQRREQAAARAAAAPQPADDAAEPVMIDADDIMDGLMAGDEAIVMQGRPPRPRVLGRPRPGLLPEPPVPSAAAKKPAPHREAIQLLDKSGLATLVRLLFFPQPLRRNVLQKVLVNLCENSRTRTELINLLLTILQDGTRDVSAVDKSFSQMSLRATKTLGQKETPRRKVPDTPGGALPHFPGESVPNLIAQRCLEALMFLVQSNDQSPLFFLTEQEIVVGLSRRGTKKGKGKEKVRGCSCFQPRGIADARENDRFNLPLPSRSSFCSRCLTARLCSKPNR